MLDVFKKANNLLKDYSARKDTKERLRSALSALNRLETIIENTIKIGITMKQTLKEATVSPSQIIAKEIYGEVDRLYEEMGNIIATICSLAERGLWSLLGFEGFMEKVH